MGGLFDSDLIPLLFVLVMLANVFLDRRNRRRRQQELPQEQQQEQQPTQAKPKDIAAEFERRLKKTTEEAQARKRQSSQGVVHDGTRVRRDDGSRVHRDGEALVHDKGKVYYDPRGDYSYDEAKMNAAAEAFNARYAQAQPAAKKRVKLKHAALVNGIIMAEVLGKPRALNPYEER